MALGKNNKRKKRVRAVLLITLMIPALLITLRAVYAISMFDHVKQEMQASGWLSTGDDSLMQVKEDLTYEASYLLFKIGTVRFQVLNKKVYDSIPAYRSRAYIDSYSGIPFVNLHAVYESLTDARTFMCLFSSNSEKQGDSWVYTSYRFNPGSRSVNWEKSKDGKIITAASFPLDRPHTDGVSFFYYLREFSRDAEDRRTYVSIPMVVDTICSTVDLTINEKREPCDVAAFDFPVDSYHMSGHINFKGLFGVTGDFVGWMSSDTAEIPLRADVKVIIGSVVVKLKDIKRANWIAPRSADQ